MAAGQRTVPHCRFYRQRVEQFINGKHTLAEARELYVRAAHLSYLLSDLASDLNAHLAAEAWAIDSYEPSWPATTKSAPGPAAR